MTIRRVTSAKGWGEVRIHAHAAAMSSAMYKAQLQLVFDAFTCSCAFLSAGGVWCRRHPRTSHWVKGVPQRHSTVVRLNCLIRRTNACCVNLTTAVCPVKVIRFYLSSVISLSSFLTAQGGLQFSPRGLRPSCSLMTARHLDQNTMGYLQWRWGPNSAMTTSLVRDTKSSHFTLALQVWTTTNE